MMIASYYISYLCVSQVNTGGRKIDVAIVEIVGKCLTLESKPNRRHLCHRQGGIPEVATPRVHHFLELGEVFRFHIFVIIHDPSEPPNRVCKGRLRCQTLVFPFQLTFLLFKAQESIGKAMLKASVFLILSKINISKALLILLATFFEVPLHQIKECLIFGLINSTVFYIKQSELLQKG